METMNDGDIFSSECCVLYVDVCSGWLLGDILTFPGHVIKRSAAVACLTVNCARAVLLYFYLRAVGRKVLWSLACVCLSVCLCALFCPQDISRTGSWITTKFGGWEQG